MTLNCSFLLQVVNNQFIFVLFCFILFYFPDSRNVYRKSNLFDATMAPKNNIMAMATTNPCETLHDVDPSRTHIHSNGTKAQNSASPNNTTVVPKLT
jgi:hypothetical protein